MKRTLLFLPFLAGLMATTALAQSQDLGEPVGEGGRVDRVTIEGDTEADDDCPLRGTVTD